MTSENSAAPLRTLAQARGLLIGAAVDADALQTESTYREVLAREFNLVTPENALKFGPVHPERERYDFGPADAIVEFAEENGMLVRGHTLVWHSQLPDWLTEGEFTRAELMAILREHIRTVVGRYRGRIQAWDVVNEAIGDDGALRDTIWLQGIGPEYLDLAFQWAHEADPEARLFYNDYGAEGRGAKADAVYALARDLLARGVPIDGVGLQMHISADGRPPPARVAANIRRLGELGLQVQITEMDVRLREPAAEDDLARQAEVYRGQLQVCLQVEDCTAFVLWGYTDRHSWVPGLAPGWGSALIFDEEYRPKPAYRALQETLLTD